MSRGHNANYAKQKNPLNTTSLSLSTPNKMVDTVYY